MVVAVPLAVAIAIATTVLLPRRARGPIAGLIDLLAAIPSVVYGLWGFIVLVPAVEPLLRWISEHNFGTRYDEAADRLMRALPGVPRLGLRMTTGPVLLAHRVVLRRLGKR